MVGEGLQEHWRAIGGALEGWRRIGGGLEEGWRRIGGGLEEDGRPKYGLGAPQCGLSTPQYGLGMPQYGLGTPSMGIMSRPLGKMTFFCQNDVFLSIFPLGRSNCLQITKNNFSRFLAFYPLISAFHALWRSF